MGAWGSSGQRVEDLADDVLLIRELGADMVGIGPSSPTLKRR
jgi:hypothetical protein